jgi:hypothetical protein
MSDELVKHELPPDESGITVSFHRDALRPLTHVVFAIPDSAQILSRSPEEFMRWCYNEMMLIAAQSRKVAR